MHETPLYSARVDYPAHFPGDTIPARTLTLSEPDGAGGQQPLDLTGYEISFTLTAPSSAPILSLSNSAGSPLIAVSGGEITVPRFTAPAIPRRYRYSLRLRDPSGALSTHFIGDLPVSDPAEAL